MAYGDYEGPDKSNKGHEGGACNRQRCQAEPALWFNHRSGAWYCADCRSDIQFDSFSLRDWELHWQPQKGHPMFETREQMDARVAPLVAGRLRICAAQSEQGLNFAGTPRACLEAAGMLDRWSTGSTDHPEKPTAEHDECEETTLDEVIRRIRDGTFYDDYDWASGPALRALDRAALTLSAESGK